MCNGGVNSASDENWKEFSSLTISSVASFNGDGDEQALNVNKTIREKNWDAKHIQILIAQQKMLQKILENVFIGKNSLPF